MKMKFAVTSDRLPRETPYGEPFASVPRVIGNAMPLGVRS